MAKVNTSQNSTTYSDHYDITYDTAQGSCLGPLLFILFCNDIQQLPLFWTPILLMDNTTLLNSHRNPGYLKFTITHNMEILLDWFNANQLLLNMNKPALICFWPKEKHFNISVNNMEVTRVSSTKFLGVYLNEELSWDMHINQLYKKLQANCHLTSHVTYSTKTASDTSRVI